MFFSATLTPTQRRWSTHDQEAFAIKKCIEKAEQLLQGVPFTVETDHKNLQWLQRSKNARVIRWYLYLQQFDFNIKHIPGKENIIADTLSRNIKKLDNKEVRAVLTNFDDLKEQIASSQKSHPYDGDKTIKLENGVSSFEDNDLIYIPPKDTKLHKAIIKCFHNATAGHHGIRATIDMIQDEKMSWPTLYKDVATFIKGCATCQKVRSNPFKNKKSLPLSIMHEKPLHTRCIDTIGPFPTTADGYKYVIVARDAFTRYTQLFPTVTLEAHEALFHIMKLIGMHRTSQGYTPSPNGKRTSGEGQSRIKKTPTSPGLRDRGKIGLASITTHRGTHPEQFENRNDRNSTKRTNVRKIQTEVNRTRLHRIEKEIGRGAAQRKRGREAI
ncbi:hypothetical protein ADUPG1_011709, partial [Aduncisulcus paluster]